MNKQMDKLKKLYEEWTSLLNTPICKHEFKGKDMQPRDHEGIVKWPCYKCGKIFTAPYGLKILEKGRCIGSWCLIKNT